MNGPLCCPSSPASTKSLSVIDLLSVCFTLYISLFHTLPLCPPLFPFSPAAFVHGAGHVFWLKALQDRPNVGSSAKLSFSPNCCHGNGQTCMGPCKSPAQNNKVLDKGCPFLVLKNYHPACFSDLQPWPTADHPSQS